LPETYEEKLINRNVYKLSPDLQIKLDEHGTILARYVRTTPGRIILNQSFIN